MREPAPVNTSGDSGVALGDALGFMMEFNANVLIFGQIIGMLEGFMSAIPGMTEYLDPYAAAGMYDPETGQRLEGPLPLMEEPVNPIVQLSEDISGLKTMLEEAGLAAGEDEDGMTVFDAAVENAVRRAMGMDEVTEKPEGMPDFLWGMGQGFFDRSLTEKPEDMSDEEWAALTGAWDVGRKAFGVDENPLEQMQMDVEALKTTVPQSTESDLRNPDKAQLRSDIVAMRECGMSYRKIGAVLGIHWTRVGQIVKSAD